MDVYGLQVFLACSDEMPMPEVKNAKHSESF
jgi:hypothetical protein